MKTKACFLYYKFGLQTVLRNKYFHGQNYDHNNTAKATMHYNIKVEIFKVFLDCTLFFMYLRLTIVNFLCKS